MCGAVEYDTKIRFERVAQNMLFEGMPYGHIGNTSAEVYILKAIL